MCEQQEPELDIHFTTLGVQAEAVISRLQKARFRAEHGDRYGLIRERRKEGRPLARPAPAAPPFPAWRVLTRKP